MKEFRGGCFFFKYCGSPSIARSLVESVGSGRSINTILSDQSARVMAVPKSLERLEVLLSEGAGASAVLEMDLVRGGKRVNPPTVGQGGLPAGVVRDIDCDTTFMVGGAWRGNWICLSALTLSLELIEEMLLSS